ncbi:MAG: hypothetical protein WEC39_01485 [Patescibacteria group bacterium]
MVKLKKGFEIKQFRQKANYRTAKPKELLSFALQVSDVPGGDDGTVIKPNFAKPRAVIGDYLTLLALVGRQITAAHPGVAHNDHPVAAANKISFHSNSFENGWQRIY